MFFKLYKLKQLHTDLSNPLKRERLEEREEIRCRYEHCIMVKKRQVCPSSKKFLTRHTKFCWSFERYLKDNFKGQRNKEQKNSPKPKTRN